LKNILQKHEIESIFELTKTASEIAKQNFKLKNYSVITKSDNSKVTSTDLEISEFFFKSFKKLFPNFSIICEENKQKEVENDIFFLIDPIDGTSSFISESKEFSINIALIKKNKPFFGLIFAPIFENGKAIFNDENNNIISFNSISNSFNKVNKIFSSQSKNLKIITSVRSEDDDINKFINQYLAEYLHKISIQRVSSAIKFILTIENQIDFYLHFRKSMEWDTAAGHLLCELHGYVLHNMQKNFNSKKSHYDFMIEDTIHYQKNNFENKPFLVTKNNILLNKI